jgi:hypothetical protein
VPEEGSDGPPLIVLVNAAVIERVMRRTGVFEGAIPDEFAVFAMIDAIELFCCCLGFECEEFGKRMELTAGD